MNKDPNAPEGTPLGFALSLFGTLALIGVLFAGVGYSRGREFNASPPREETWRAAIHSNTWDDSLAVDAPCAVRRRSAMTCRRGCGWNSVTLVECGGRVLFSASNSDAIIFMPDQGGNVDEWHLGAGTRMLWDHDANTLILESTTALEPRRLALRLAPTSTVEVAAQCRATLRDAFGLDSTPECGYAYVDRAVTLDRDID